MSIKGKAFIPLCGREHRPKMVTERTYTKEEMMKVFEYMLKRYSDIEVVSYWKDEYVGTCYDKMEIKKTEKGFDIKVYTAIC